MLEGRIAQANGRLRAARVGVVIEVKGNRLYLRATFPTRPGSSKTTPHQQRLALGFHANPAGLKLAESEGRKVGALLDCGEFSWTPYMQIRTDSESVGAWVEKFEADYFTRRERNPKSETTWQKDYQQVFSALPEGEPLTLELLTNAIAQKSPDTRTRKRWVMVCTKLARFASMEPDFGKLSGKYSFRSTAPRNLPDDRKVAEWRERILNPLWQRAYGLLATYGIRPHEVFRCNFDKFPVLQVEDDSKTGYHRVYPFYPEWANSWDLRGDLPIVTGRNNTDLGNRVSKAFKRYGVPFLAYDLRHAWAIRTISFRLPTTLAARMMGHSVEVHEKVYQQWITEDFETQVLEKLMQGDRPLPPT